MRKRDLCTNVLHWTLNKVDYALLGEVYHLTKIDILTDLVEIYRCLMKDLE